MRPEPGQPLDPSSLTGVAHRLFEEGYAFDFFQAVRLLGWLAPNRQPVGTTATPHDEIVRFATRASLSFPPSALYEIRAGTERRVPTMVVNFMGLTGPSGVLPRHYTELLMQQERYSKSAEKGALAAWLGLFDHRLIALFYRAWEKYHFHIAYERNAATGKEDAFTRVLFSLVGMGTPGLRGRLRIGVVDQAGESPGERVLARIDDLGLLRYGGLLARRPRTAQGLEVLLEDYFNLPVRVVQFRGQWLQLDAGNQSRLGPPGSNSSLGRDLVVGERVWDVQGKFLLRVGPMSYAQFRGLMPDRSPNPECKSFFLLCHLTRLFVGPELDFDVQLILKAEDVPLCKLGGGSDGARLGWNTWVHTRPLPRDAEDAVFKGEEIVRLPG